MTDVRSHRDLMIEEAFLEISRQSGAPIRDDETIRAGDYGGMIDMGLVVDAVLDRARKCGWMPPWEPTS